MSRIPRSLLAAGALVAFAACDDAAAPKGVPGDLTVRAYVDRDASGTFTAGDLAIQGAVVTVTPVDGASTDAREATTDGTGQATFAALEPGRYTLAMGSGVPAGAVLTTNPTPTVAISYQGAVSGQSEFRFSFYPGSISGQIYRDDSGNGQYDAGQDTPGANFLVVLRAASNGTPGAVVDSVRADANGVYSFPRVAAGNYFLEYENPGTITYTGGQSVAITVQPQAPLTPPAAVFTGSLVIPIDQARARAAGANVEVEGIITVAPGMFTAGTGSANSEVWVQDATGGIAAYQIPTSTTGLAVGQRVSVRGQRQDVSGQEQIGSATTTGATITAIAGTGTVAPQLVTIQQAVARTGFEGELVTLSGFTVTATPTASAGADYTVNGTVAGTAFQLRVEGSTGIPASSFTAGTRYSVTGILTEFNGTSQIKPRSAADVAGPTPIATVRTQATGTTATVAGIVTAAPGSFTSASGGVNGVNSEVWVQDASGGIAVFPVPTTTTLALGDIVEVSGTLNPFAGQIQLSNNPTVTLLGTGTPVAPRRVTGAEFNARTYEGQLVTLTGVTVTSVPTGTSSAFNVIGTTPDGQTVVIRVTGPTTSGVIVQNTGLTRADFTVGQLYTLTGIATVNVNATTGVATVQLKPRMRSDVVVGVVATPANVIINEFMANPNLVADNAGEYIELHNAGGTDQNLQGWIISDNFGVDTIDVPLVIPAGGYVLLGVNADRALNGNIPVDFQYTSNIALGNSGDRIQLRDPSNVTVDSVAYTSNAQAGAGVAWGVVDAAVDNTLATGSSNWVAQTTLYNTADKGTPRARNDGQTGALRAAPGSTSGTTGKTGTTLGTKTKLTLRR